MSRLPTLVAALAAAVAIPSIALSHSAGRNVWSGVYGKAQASRGAAAYAANCAACHGSALRGSDSAPALTGGSFLANWDGQSGSALFVRIKTTMPLNNPGSLAAAKVADIESFILSRNGFPAGTADLPADAAQQSLISITQDKPSK